MKSASIRNMVVLIIVLILVSQISKSIFICRMIVLAILLLCIKLGKKERYYLNPMFLFCATPFSLLIYMNLGDVYMLNLTFDTWMFAIINMVAFIIAYNATSDFSKPNLCTGNTKVKSLKKLAIFFYLLSLSAYIIPSLASITWMFSIVSIVCALKTRNKNMMIFVALIFAIGAIGHVSKSAMLHYSIAFVICFEKYFVDNEQQRKRIKWVLGLGVVFMLFSFSFANKDRGNYDSNEGVDYYTRRGLVWNYDAGLFMPYMYMTNGWTNLQYVMETQDKRTYGLWTAKPLLGYLQLKDYFGSYYKIIPYSSFNTCAYMTYGFKDFGYFFSVLMSLFLGFFVRRVYSRYRMSRSPYDVASYVLVGQATLQMFFSNHFFTQSYPFTIIILMAMVKYIMRKHNTPPDLEE